VVTLRVREYERLSCGAVFAPEKREVTPAQRSALEHFSESYRRTRGVTVFQNGPKNTLVAQNFVGVINLGKHQLEVLPKIEGTDTEVRGNLMNMVAETLGMKLHADTLSQIDRNDQTILELMIRLFCEELWQAVRRGIVKRYESRDDNLVVLRGRLNVSQQIRHNLARPDRLHCTFDEFCDDNELNRVLKCALRVVLRAARTPSTARSVSELLFCFQDVADVDPDALRWERVGLDRTSDRYRPLVKLARLFIDGSSPDLIAGAGDGFAVLFDMNELFEEYVGRQARHVFGKQGLSVSLQGPKRHLAKLTKGSHAFELRPDVVVSAGPVPQVVLDTKWKRLREDAKHGAVSSADMYQMYAYSHRYQVEEVVLLYPHHSGLGPWKARRAEYELPGTGVDGALRRIVVATIDLTHLGTVRDQLRAVAPSHSGLAVALVWNAAISPQPVDAPDMAV
jgi:5-methylcytosine-specific restriction enzyme subunit McrC